MSLQSLIDGAHARLDAVHRERIRQAERDRGAEQAITTSLFLRDFPHMSVDCQWEVGDEPDTVILVIEGGRWELAINRYINHWTITAPDGTYQEYAPRAYETIEDRFLIALEHYYR